MWLRLNIHNKRKHPKFVHFIIHSILKKFIHFYLPISIWVPLVIPMPKRTKREKSYCENKTVYKRQLVKYYESFRRHILSKRKMESSTSCIVVLLYFTNKIKNHNAFIFFVFFFFLQVYCVSVYLYFWKIYLLRL